MRLGVILCGVIFVLVSSVSAALFVPCESDRECSFVLGDVAYSCVENHCRKNSFSEQKNAPVFVQIDTQWSFVAFEEQERYSCDVFQACHSLAPESENSSFLVDFFRFLFYLDDV